MKKIIWILILLILGGFLYYYAKKSIDEDSKNDIIQTNDELNYQESKDEEQTLSIRNIFDLAGKLYSKDNLTLDEERYAVLNLNNDQAVDYVGIYYNKNLFDSQKQLIIFNIEDNKVKELKRYEIPKGYKISKWNIYNSDFSNRNEFVIRLEKTVNAYLQIGMKTGYELMDLSIMITEKGDLKVKKKNYPFLNIEYGSSLELDGETKKDIILDPSFYYYDENNVNNVSLYTLNEKDIGDNIINFGSLSDGIDLSKLWNIYVGEYRLAVTSSDGDYKNKVIVSPEIKFILPDGLSEELFPVPAYIKDYKIEGNYIVVDYREGDDTPADISEGYLMRLNLYEDEGSVSDQIYGVFDHTVNKWKIDISKVNKNNYSVDLVGWCGYHSNFSIACARRYPLIVGLSPQVFVEDIKNFILRN